jgi:hypothetical protein
MGTSRRVWPFGEPRTRPARWTVVTDSAMTARRRPRSSRPTFTLAEGFRASRPSRTASSRISERTRWILRTLAGSLRADRYVTHRWTSAWDTSESRTEPQVGTMWWRAIPA